MGKAREAYIQLTSGDIIIVTTWRHTLLTIPLAIGQKTEVWDCVPVARQSNFQNIMVLHVDSACELVVK